ncbi:MAG: hypothetical protein KME46_06290 [Brasilonema angustatum HA4187-MV1]|nr:hypothetical protein [Brasilonema angustatum HA4187-MV1]
MLEFSTRVAVASLLVAVCPTVALASPSIPGKDSGPSGAFTYSADPSVATLQRHALYRHREDHPIHLHHVAKTGGEITLRQTTTNH